MQQIDPLWLGFAGALLIVGLVIWFAFSNRSGGRYPDGKCYLCRRGRCWPGETCDKCGTPQP